MVAVGEKTNFYRHATRRRLSDEPAGTLCLFVRMGSPESTADRESRAAARAEVLDNWLPFAARKNIVQIFVI